MPFLLAEMKRWEWNMAIVQPRDGGLNISKSFHAW